MFSIKIAFGAFGVYKRKWNFGRYKKIIIVFLRDLTVEYNTKRVWQAFGES